MLRCVSVAAVAAFLTIVATSNQVSAADKPLSWDGFSVSVGGGAAKVDTGLAAQSANLDAVGVFAGFFPLASFLGGALGNDTAKNDNWEGFGTLQLGYDKRFGNLVIGALADYDFYPDKPTATGSEGVDGFLAFNILGFPGFAPIPDYAQLNSRVELKGVWSVGGRLGVVVSPNTLIYGLGGYTQARIDGQADLTYFDIDSFGAKTLTVRMPDRLNGYFLGAGGEVKVTDGVALRLEYRYANYKGESREAAVSSAGGFFAFPVAVGYAQAGSIAANVDADIHTVRGALVLQLGQP